METKNTKIALNKFGKKTVADIAAQLKRLKADSSGRLIRSLNYKLKEGIDEMNVNFEALDYFNNIEDGRKAGSKMPPPDSLTQWLKTKGIPESAKFAIAKSIGKFGIKPKPIMSEVLKSNNNKKEFDNLAYAIGNDILAWIDKNIIDKFKK